MDLGGLRANNITFSEENDSAKCFLCFFLSFACKLTFQVNRMLDNDFVGIVAAAIVGTVVAALEMGVLAVDVPGLDVRLVVDVPVEGDPVKGVPVLGAPAEGVPVQDAPVQGVPVLGVLVLGVPVSGDLAEDVPVKDGSEVDDLVVDAPAVDARLVVDSLVAPDTIDCMVAVAVDIVPELEPVQQRRQRQRLYSIKK